MHDKFQIAGFQKKRDIHHRSLSFICLFLLGHLPVQVTLWFLASDSREIQASVEDFRPINKNFQIYATYFLIL